MDFVTTDGFRLSEKSLPLEGEFKEFTVVAPTKTLLDVSKIFSSAENLISVVYNQSDFSWAEQYAEKVSGDCLLFLQPEWSRAKELTPSIISYIQRNPKWILSLQTHKYIDIP